MPMCNQPKILKTFTVSYYFKNKYDDEIKYLDVLAYSLRQALWKFHNFHKDLDLVSISERI